MRDKVYKLNKVDGLDVIPNLLPMEAAVPGEKSRQGEEKPAKNA